MKPGRFAYDGICELLQPQGFLLLDSRVLLDGARRPHTERLESRCLSMDAWERHLIFPLFSQDNTGSICGLLGELPRGES